MRGKNSDKRFEAIKIYSNKLQVSMYNIVILCDKPIFSRGNM